ncbi:MAG: hypothetical protein ACI4QR_07250 [Eubacteriales bacterium]
MTIREYKKNLMIVKNIDSDLIGEAYFILKSDAGTKDEEIKISDEAERILRECSAKRKKTHRRIPAALLGFFMGTGICAFIAALVFLCIQLSM